MRLLLIVILGLLPLCSQGKEPSQTEKPLQTEKSALDQFMSDAFPSGTPETKMLWLNNQQRQQATDVLGHRFAALRVRYWHSSGRSAWVMDEIGKERPITIVVVVAGSRIEQLKVEQLKIEQLKVEQVKILEYRESRGGEVRYPFFTKQFIGVGLEPPDDANPRHKPKLDNAIDGISGATLSVRAVKKIAILALLFHSYLDPDLNEQLVTQQ